MGAAAKRFSVPALNVSFSGIGDFHIARRVPARGVGSKQQIIDAILPLGDDVTPNAVEVYISRVRHKTLDAGIAIRTIRGFGYMLEQAAPEDTAGTPASTPTA